MQTLRKVMLWNCFPLATVLVCAVSANRAVADTFGSGANTFDIEFVTIGNPGNAADTTGSPNPAGAVPYAYRMGKFEISEQMIDKANALGGLGITKDTRGPDKPATSTSWNEAARFVNWLNTSTGSVPAYKFAFQPGEVGYDANANIELWTPSDAGYNPNNLYRNSLAQYFLPSVDEWYKAAYFDPTSDVYYDYPTGSDSVPDGIDFVGDLNFDAVFCDGCGGLGGPNDISNVGLLSAYGTAGQGGNVAEWEETKFTLLNNLSPPTVRGVRGGYWNNLSYYLSSSDRGFGTPGGEGDSRGGFRVASIAVPEPGTLLLLCFGSLAVWWRRRRLVCAALLAAVVSVSFADRAAADTFGSGVNTFDIEFVTIGNPGNAADTTGNPNPAGSVPYAYRMGKFEISEQMIDKANTLGDLGITKDNRGPDKPATSTSWNEAARFVNWLNTSTGSTPAYKFALQPGDIGYSAITSIELWTIGDAGYNPNNLYRNSLARYFLPSIDEWYKAAYYHPTGGVYYDYPTGSDSAPDGIDFQGDSVFDAVCFDGFNQGGPNDIAKAGILSPYGTMGQGGNVYEWEETDVDLMNGPTPGSTNREARGGNWASSTGLLAANRLGVGPSVEVNIFGFRVASIAVPEPSTLLLLCFGSLAALWRRRGLVCAAVLVAGFVGIPTSAQAAEVRTVALSGQQASGTPNGVNFGDAFSAPVLNDAGQTAFRANVSNLIDVSFGGIWSEGYGSLALVASNGSQAAGTPGGVNFGDVSGFSLVLNDAGQTAFFSQLTGSGIVVGANSTGIWSEGSGSLALVARNGDPAPGTPSGVNYRSIDFRPVMNNAGQTAFLAFASNGVDLGGSGIWSEGSGNLALVAGHGSQAPGTPSGVNYRFTSNSEPPVLNDAGQTAFSALLTGSGVSGSNDEGIWSEGSGSLALVAREGDHAPGTPSGVNFTGLTQFRSPVLNNAGQTAFGARLTDGGSGIWSEGSGSLALVALSGQQAPGMPSGETFVFSNSSPSNPVLNDAGQTAFWAYTSNGNGIWLEDSGSLTSVVRAGNHAPGTPSGVSFSSFTNTTPVLNNAGQIAFTNYLTGSDVDGANDKGIWATDRSGQLQLIAREGDLLEVAPGDFRTIKDFTNSNGSSPDFDFTGNTGNSDGRHSSFNNLGQLAFSARFTDGTSGIFVSNRVAVPEPSTLLLLCFGSLAVLSRRRSLVCASILAVVVCTATSSQAAEIRTVSLSGQQAPGMAGGITYSYFLDEPVLNESGQVAFRAGLTGSGVDATNDDSVWSDGSGTLAIVAREGNHAPGTSNGVSYGTGRPFDYFVINDAGEMAFRGFLTGDGVVAGTNDVGIWSVRSGDLALVALGGNQAPGVPTGVTFNTLNFHQPVLNNSGDIAFSAGLRNADGVFIGNGIWADRSGSLAQLSLVDQTGGGDPLLNDTGQIVASLGGRSVDRFVYDSGGWSRSSIVRSEDPAPGVPSGVNFSIIAQSVLNDAGHIAFRALLTGSGVNSTNNDGIYSEKSGSLTLVARKGDPAPGTPSGVNFGNLSSIFALNDLGQTAFIANVAGTGVVFGTNNTGIWLEDSGSLTLVARAGDHAPGTPSGVNFSSQFLSFLVLNDAGQTAFRARVTGSLRDGIWATDRDGVLQLIAREDDLLEVAPGDFRTISSLYLEAEDSTGNSDGRPSAFNNRGQLAFGASFTDGSSGVFVSNRVAVPEPSTLLLLGFGSLAALWRRRGLVFGAVL